MTRYADYQPMTTYGTARPTVAPWRYGATVLSSRAFAIGLAVADAVVSYGGMRDLEIGRGEAAMGAAFILIVQSSVAIALTSGQPIGESFNARFFKDKGKMGQLKRWLGYVLLSAVVLLYLVDAVTNFAAFTGGDFLPNTGAEGLRAAIAIVFALGLTFGDELLHVFSDENSLGATANRVSHQAQTHHAALQARYQQHYMKSAKDVADELGQQHGESWRPGDNRRQSQGQGQQQHPPKGKGKQDDGQSYNQH
jgi:hypothetical protein